MGRYICLTGLLGQLVVGVVVMPLVNLIYYFTNWTLIISIISVGMSIRAVNDSENFPKSMHNLALHHLLYTVAIGFNLVTVCVYWTLIHKENMVVLKGQNDKIF